MDENFIVFKAPCGHLVRMDNPKTAEWSRHVCITVENGNYCAKKVDRRKADRRQPCMPLPQQPQELTEEDKRFLSDLKISI